MIHLEMNLYYYSVDEIRNYLSKMIFILSFPFHVQCFSTFNNLLSFINIKSIFNDKEIEQIKIVIIDLKLIQIMISKMTVILLFYFYSCFWFTKFI